MHQGIAPQDPSPGDVHRLLLHCVAPRPIAFVSTVFADGKPNLAPFSYFMAGGANPPSVVVSPLTDRDGEPKDTLRNIQETREYTISVVTYPMQERMNHTSTEFPYGVSEWEEASFERADSAHVRPPWVAESPKAIECRLFQIVPHGNGCLCPVNPKCRTF
jgi:flavin reductase (DIM6/NTAB) family NADH-FMN oxidoreductase RutF